MTRLGSGRSSGVLAAGIAFFLFVACYNGSVALRLARGETAQARVVSVVHYPKATTVTVEFTDARGELVRAECTSCSSTLSEGDAVEIRYDPSSPRLDVEDAHRRGTLNVTIFALIAIAALSVAIVVVRRRSTLD